MSADRESPQGRTPNDDETQSQAAFVGTRVDGVVEGVAFGWVRLRRGVDAESLVATVDGVERDLRLFPRTSESATVDAAFTFRVKGVRPAPGCPVALELRHAPTGELAPGMPWVADVEDRYGHVDGVAGTSLVGWASRGDGLAAELELVVDGQVAARTRASRVRRDMLAWDIGSKPVGFEIELPDAVFDGAPHSLAVRFADGGSTLAGGLPAFRYAPLGAFDRVAPDCVEGWLLNPDSLDAPIELELFAGGESVSRGENVLPRTDVRALHGRLRTGFCLRVPAKRVEEGEPQFLELRLRGRPIRALGAPLAVVPRTEVLAYLERVATRSLVEHSSATPLDGALDAWFRTTAIPSLLAEVRDRLREGSRHAVIGHAGVVDTPKASERRPVAVVVPVYRGLDETRACLESVLRASGSTPFRLVVVNDASPEPELTAWLRTFAESDSRILLVENRVNLGFVGTVNRGMALAPQSDVVMLNADTEVPDGWLDALVRVADAHPEIGTITPLSNRATICSVPRSNVDNDMPPGMDVNAMHRLCVERNGDEAVDIPTGVGFCMYVRRATLDEVGELDAALWNKGYGEENDFCFRARARGWRNVAATGCFVLHHGSVSFGAEKSVHVAANLAQLNRIYPDYDPRIGRFVDDDPMRIARTRINLALLQRQQRPRVLHLVHDLGGGTDTAVKQIAQRLSDEGMGSLIARPWGEDGLRILDEEAEHDLVFDLGREGSLVDAALAALDIRLVHLHHAMGVDARIFAHADKLAVPRVASVHDYHWVCPRVNLLDAHGRFCDLPEASTCDACVRAAPVGPEVEDELETVGYRVAEYREAHLRRLRAAATVLCPSEDTATRMRRAYPELPVVARPHPDRRRKLDLLPEGFDRDAVVVIGAIGPNKGFESLRRLVEHAEEAGSALRFFVAGYTCDDSAFMTRSNVRILGRYDEKTLPGQLLEARAKVALFLSPWPETYAYTLSEALAFGLYPVALDLGAMPERIDAVEWGQVISHRSTPSEMLAALMAARDQVRQARAAYTYTGSSYGSLWQDYYGQPALPVAR